MRIVIAIDVPMTQNNGTAVAASNVASYLHRQGHQIRLLCPDPSLQGKPGCYITPTLNLGPLNHYVAKNGVLISRTDDEIIRRALANADHLHVMTPFFLCCRAAKLAREMGLSVTAGFHCQAENLTNHLFLMNSSAANGLAYRIFDKNLYRHVDAIHYPTRFIRDVFEQEIGRTTPGYVISNGVSPAFTRARSPKPAALADKYVVLFTGRYSKEKSHATLIEAAARSRYKDRLQLIFAGDGPLRDKLEALSRKKLPIQPIFGFHPRAELVDIIHYADLYVHPAEIEIEAIAALEAITGGLVPVICDSPRSATRHFALQPENLFPCDDPDALAARMDAWLSDPEAREQCSRAYEGYTARFARAQCMAEMEQMMLRAHAARKDRSHV